MNKIYKYKIAMTDEQVLVLPEGAQIISIIEQYGKPVVYAMVNTKAQPDQIYNIRTIGTGQAIGDNLSKYKFIGTLSFRNVNLVFHYFIKLMSSELGGKQNE